MESLPREIMQNILGRLPLKDVMALKIQSNTMRDSLDHALTDATPHSSPSFLVTVTYKQCRGYNTRSQCGTAVWDVEQDTLLHSDIVGDEREVLASSTNGVYWVRVRVSPSHSEYMMKYFICHPSYSVKMEVPMPPPNGFFPIYGICLLDSIVTLSQLRQVPANGKTFLDLYNSQQKTWESFEIPHRMNLEKACSFSNKLSKALNYNSSHFSDWGFSLVFHRGSFFWLYITPDMPQPKSLKRKRPSKMDLKIGAFNLSNKSFMSIEMPPSYFKFDIEEDHPWRFYGCDGKLLLMHFNEKESLVSAWKLVQQHEKFLYPGERAVSRYSWERVVFSRGIDGLLCKGSRKKRVSFNDHHIAVSGFLDDGQGCGYARVYNEDGQIVTGLEESQILGVVGLGGNKIYKWNTNYGSKWSIVDVKLSSFQTHTIQWPRWRDIVSK